jgi:hypothetical protein
VPQVHALADEQRHAAAAAEVAAKRISELTLHFRSAEQLAREMTERAKVAERARVHDESLRLHAEGLVRKAEAAVAEQGRLLRETQQALSRAQEQAGVSEGKEARVRQAELDNKRLHAEVMELKGLLNREHADDEQARRLAREEFALAEEARERLAATARELEAARAALGAEQSARREADARLAAAEADRDHALLDLETARGAAADASAAGAVHLVRREEAEAARSAGEARMAELEAEVLAAREAVCAAERAAEEALADLGTARAALEAARRESAELQERAAQRAERLEGELRGAKDAVHEVQVRLDATGAELRERVHELESALEVRTQSAKVAEASANEAAVQVASLKQLLEENRMVMHDMEDQVVHCVRETRDEKKAAGEAAADAVALRQNVEASAAENAEIRTQLSSFKEQLVVAEHKAEKAVAMEQQAATKAVEAVKAVEKVASELTVVKATAAALETRNAECEKEAKAAEEVRVQLGKAEAKLETTKREVATLREDNVGLQRAVANVESELRESVMRAEKMTATVQELHSQDGGNDELFKERIRELEGEIEALQDDWAEAQKRLDQYLALPNPCGVGMRLDTFKKPDGNLGFKVNDLVIGLSADLSGVIEPGDELLEIQNTDVAGLTLGQVMAHSHGARGSTVTFRFLRGANGYRIILKRGPAPHRTAPPRTARALRRAAGTRPSGAPCAWRGAGAEAERRARRGVGPGALCGDAGGQGPAGLRVMAGEQRHVPAAGSSQGHQDRVPRDVPRAQPQRLLFRQGQGRGQRQGPAQAPAGLPPPGYHAQPPRRHRRARPGRPHGLQLRRPAERRRPRHPGPGRAAWRPAWACKRGRGREWVSG